MDLHLTNRWLKPSHLKDPRSGDAKTQISARDDQLSREKAVGVDGGIYRTKRSRAAITGGAKGNAIAIRQII